VAEVEIDRVAGVRGAPEAEEDTRTRPRGAVPEGCQGAVWDQLERAKDKYGKDPQTGAINYNVIVAPGRPKASVDNVSTILEMDTRWRGKVRYNAFRDLIEVEGKPLSDRWEIGLLRWLDRVYMMNAPPAVVSNGVIGASLSAEHHPLREYLSGTRRTWDGEQRAVEWMSTYLGVEDTPLTRAMGTKFLVSMVARAFAELPRGVKCDTTLILIGRQGARKSTAFATLAGPQWFSDSPLDLGNKDAMSTLHGVWLYEFAELDAIRPREVTQVKAFLSAPVDKYRAAYARNTGHHARSVVFCGTTNAETGAFLTDPTGSRRFWPVEVGAIDLEGLAEDRDQLWGEAMALHQAGTLWWMDEDEAQALSGYSERYQQYDSWSDLIGDWLRSTGKTEASPSEILTDGLEIPKGQQTKSHQMRIAGAMAVLGWCRSRTTRKGRRVTLWREPERP